MVKRSLFYQPKPKKQDVSRRRWKPLRIVGKAVLRTCTLLGAVMLFSSLVVTLSTIHLVGQQGVSLPKEMILVTKVSSAFLEHNAQSDFSNFLSEPQPTIRQIVDALDKAKDDKRVKGLVFSIKGGGIPLAHIQELRTAVKRFRESGKRAYIYSSSYGDYGQGLGLYYLASAFEKISMQPVGMVLVNGISSEIPFARAALDKIGVKPEVIQREEYKSAYESATHGAISPQNEEMVRKIIDDMASVLLQDISRDRKISPSVLKNIIDIGILTGEEAVQKGLIDSLEYADVFIDSMRKDVGFDPEFEEPDLVNIGSYISGGTTQADLYANMDKKTGNVALVYASGAIMPSGDSSPYGGEVVAADKVSSAILKAAKDDSVDAIVVRVNSPGGSPTASETIRRSLVFAKDKGKKVVVSMGPMAASGGYWIVAEADYIFALPTTLTGSIGVVSGKASLEELWKKVGVHWDTISWGKNAGLFSFNDSLSESELSRMNHIIDNIYAAFLERVSKGRQLSVEETRSVARGRVWSGKSALNVGLVDALGGLDDALDYTAKEIGLNDRTDLNIEVIPYPKTPIEQLADLLGQQAVIARGLMAVENTLMQWQPYLSNVARIVRPNDHLVFESEISSF